MRPAQEAADRQVQKLEAKLREARLLAEQWKRSSTYRVRQMGADLEQVLEDD